jgi:O-antigen ligase
MVNRPAMIEQSQTYVGFQPVDLGHEQVRPRADAPIRIIRYLFYAFIFSLCFETVGQDMGLIEPPTVVGGLLVLSVLLQPGLFLRWPPKAFWCFIIFLYLHVVQGLVEPSMYRAAFITDSTVLTQLTVLGWLSFCIMRDRDTALRTLLTLGIACTLLGMLQLSGIAQSSIEPKAKGAVVRAAVFGFHPNHLGRIIVLGMLALIGPLYFARRKTTSIWILVSACIAILAAVLLQTGSRGAILAFGLSLLTFAFRRGSFKKKVINVGGLVILLGILAFAAFESDVMRSRFEETIETGDLARREKIYPTALEMFKERPLIGWGPVTSIYELGMRLGHPEEDVKNPHNLILYGVVTSGVLGSLPLFVGLGLCVFTAWRTRNGPHGVLPLAMVIAVLAVNMSGVWLFNKLHWVVMAYALASVYYQPATEPTPAETAGDVVYL